jgi:2-oxoglutarate ferredoxin oxidoreductase subunit beta
VTFNNHESSTKGYKWAKEHEELLHQIDFIPHFEPIDEVQYEEGETKEVEMHDGSRIRLRKLERDFNPMSKEAAMRMLSQTKESGEFLTGLIYVNPVAKNFIDLLKISETPLAILPDDKVRPGPEVLEEVMRELM